MASDSIDVAVPLSPEARERMSTDDFEAYLRLVRGGLTPGREQIYNFVKVDK